MMTFERVLTRIDIEPDNAVLDPAPPDVIPECRAVDALHAVIAVSPSGGATEPDSALFGLYTRVNQYVEVPVYVLTWTDVPARSSGPAGRRPRPPTIADVHYVVRTADCTVLHSTTVGGPR